MSEKSSFDISPYIKLIENVDSELKDTLGSTFLLLVFGPIPFLAFKFGKMLLKKDESQEREMLLKEIIKRQTATQRALHEQAKNQDGKIKKLESILSKLNKAERELREF